MVSHDHRGLNAKIAVTRGSPAIQPRENDGGLQWTAEWDRPIVLFDRAMQGSGELAVKERRRGFRPTLDRANRYLRRKCGSSLPWNAHCSVESFI